VVGGEKIAWEGAKRGGGGTRRKKRREKNATKSKIQPGGGGLEGRGLHSERVGRKAQLAESR